MGGGYPAASRRLSLPTSPGAGTSGCQEFVLPSGSSGCSHTRTKNSPGHSRGSSQRHHRPLAISLDINKTERGERVSVRSRGRLEEEEKARHGGGCCSREQSLALPTTTPAPSTIQTNAFASGAGLFISATEREGTEE